MTAQIDDIFNYEGATYSVAGISNRGLFTPEIFDLTPTSRSSSCWRGYQVTYAIVDNHLVVASLYINLIEAGSTEFKRQEGPIINNISPIGPNSRYDFFNNYYEGLNHQLAYSGGLLLGGDFLREFYVHMGFHPAWKYRQVIELVFDKGILVRQFNRSEKMADIREKLSSGKDENYAGMPSSEEIREFVERAFDRSY